MMSKRIFDLFFSILGLFFLTPMFVAIAIWVKLDSRGPVFFRQARVGRFGCVFKIHKFRTMVVDAEKKGLQLTIGADPRLTCSGRFLRRYKLDELPQLLDVIKGDMSLVGPRPEVPRYVALYTQDQRRVLDSVPGITDPASIQYRDESKLLALSEDPERTYVEDIMPAKLQRNLEYMARATVWRDFLVILQTLRQVWAR